MSKDSMDIHVEKLEDGLRIEIRGKGIPECCVGMSSAMAKIASFCCSPANTEEKKEKNKGE